jgi:apolipoprotein N-acyltransferase
MMLVPAWDFDLDRWAHGHLAIMRGVEDGFTIAGSDAAPFSTLVTDVPVAHDLTLYRRLGDWLAWLMLATLTGVFIRAAAP